MPLLSCDPLVLVGAVGSIEGVRSQLLRRGCSAVVSETVGTPFPSRKHRIRQCHCNAVPQRANWVGGSDSRAQGTDAEHTIVADHPASRITVTTSTNPQGTQIVSVTAPHSPLVAGHAPTIPTPTKGEWWPLLTPQCTTGGRLRVIHSITKVLLSLARPSLSCTPLQWAHSFFFGCNSYNTLGPIAPLFLPSVRKDSAIHSSRARLSAKVGDSSEISSMYEVFWNKKPPLLPIQRRLTARFEKDVKEELKVSRTELAIPLRTPCLSSHRTRNSPANPCLSSHRRSRRASNPRGPTGTL